MCSKVNVSNYDKYIIYKEICLVWEFEVEYLGLKNNIFSYSKIQNSFILEVSLTEPNYCSLYYPSLPKIHNEL